jgi:hypothetical protein
MNWKLYELIILLFILLNFSLNESCNLYMKDMTHLIQPVDRRVAIHMINKIKKPFRDLYDMKHIIMKKPRKSKESWKCHRLHLYTE